MSVKDPFIDRIDQLLSDVRDGRAPTQPYEDEDQGTPYRRQPEYYPRAYRRPSIIGRAFRFCLESIISVIKRPLLLIIVIICILGFHLAVTGKIKFTNERGTWRGFKIELREFAK